MPTNPNHDDDILTPAQVALWVATDTNHLAVWRHRTRKDGVPVGPPFFELAPRSPRYSRKAVQAWLDERAAERAEFSPAIKSAAPAHTGPVLK